jgi:hypothetical protein
MTRLKILFPRTSPSSIIRAVVAAIVDQAQTRRSEADAQFLQYIDNTLADDPSIQQELGGTVRESPGHP